MGIGIHRPSLYYIFPPQSILSIFTNKQSSLYVLRNANFCDSLRLQKKKKKKAYLADRSHFPSPRYAFSLLCIAFFLLVSSTPFTQFASTPWLPDQLTFCSWDLAIPARSTPPLATMVRQTDINGIHSPRHSCRNITPELIFLSARHAFTLWIAGFLFIDYLANVMAMDQKWRVPPVLQRRMNLTGRDHVL